MASSLRASGVEASALWIDLGCIQQVETLDGSGDTRHAPTVVRDEDRLTGEEVYSAGDNFAGIADRKIALSEIAAGP